MYRERQNGRKKEGGGGGGQCPRNQLKKRKTKYVSVNIVSSVDANKFFQSLI